jgi:hypothetical protein
MKQTQEKTNIIITTTKSNEQHQTQKTYKPKLTNSLISKMCKEKTPNSHNGLLTLLNDNIETNPHPTRKNTNQPHTITQKKTHKNHSYPMITKLINKQQHIAKTFPPHTNTTHPHHTKKPHHTLYPLDCTHIKKHTTL